MEGWLPLELSAKEVVSSRNSEVKVNRKKMEREYFGFFSPMTVSTWSCIRALYVYAYIPYFPL